LLPSEIEESEIAVAGKAAGNSTRRDGLPARLLGMDRGNLLQRLLPWAHKGGLTILDQGLISGSNFLISVLLAQNSWL